MPFFALLASLVSGLVGIAVRQAVAAATAQIGAPLLLSAAASALFGPPAPKQQDVARELASPTTAPSYRQSTARADPPGRRSGRRSRARSSGAAGS